jgi:AraC-like DNA-binding protein
VGALLAGFLTGLAEQAGTLRTCDAPRLETAVVDLLSATLAHHLDAEDRLPPETRTRTLTRRIRAFILKHLRDPDLTPMSIAAAHHISVSYLYRLFQQEGTTVAAWIRQQRLEAARRDLADPALGGLPVQDIAVRWGFSLHSSFTRAFQVRYGLSPRDYRRQAVG